MTTRANSQLPRPDFHRQDKQPYGLRATVRMVNVLPVPAPPDKREIRFRSVDTTASRCCALSRGSAWVEDRALREQVGSKA